MGTLTRVDLGAGADTPSADTLYEGFIKVNNNMDALEEAPDAASSGAKQIGYFDGTSATTVQDALGDALTETFTGDNVGAGDAEVFKDKTPGLLNFRTISGTTNVTVQENGDVIEISASLSATSNVTKLVSTDSPYPVVEADEILLINTEDAAFTVNLPAGTDKRILTIKNLAWNGNAASATDNTTEVTIDADGTENVEDDRTAMPSAITAIGPGSAMRVVFDASTDVWCII